MILRRNDSCEQAERGFQGALHAALGLLGWIVPDTEAAVRATRDELGSHELNVLSGSVSGRESKPERTRSDVA